LEQCELGVPITQSCEDQGTGYYSGSLTCDYATCNFNVDTCLSCGNGKIESYNGITEVCDGNDFGNKTCRNFGTPPFLNGKLKCSANCQTIDTTGCNRSLCGNGIIDGEEECDGNNLGVPPKTCTDLGCTGGGPVRCQDNCTFSKTSCTGCQAEKCTNVSTSPWSSPFQFRIPCCGSRDGEWADDLTEQSTGLCPGGVRNFKKIGSSEFLGWEWDCGDPNNKCRAYKNPVCGAHMTQFEPSNCSVNVTTDTSIIYKDKATLEKILDGRSAAGKDHMCDGGSDWTYPCLVGQSWAMKNWGASCRNTNGKGETKTVSCVAGWAEKGACGSRNGQAYTATNGDSCASDAAVTQFFNLTNLNANDGFCAPGSKLVKKGYYFGWDYAYPMSEYPPYDGFLTLAKRHFKKWFGWQCQLDDSRNGPPVDCRATLNTDICGRGSDAKCGPAEDGHFAYEGKGPTSGFCEAGKLGGRFEYLVSLNREKPATWSWYCLSEDGRGQNAYCSVTADVYCGEAQEGSYATANEARAAGLCGGRHAVEKDAIRSVGGKWQWSCADTQDSSATVSCWASNRKCGYADGRSYLAGTFEANKQTANFLCQGNANPTVSLSSNFPSKWTWNCGTTQCSSTLLECGWGGVENGDNYFTDQDFHNNGNVYQSFMCSNGLAAVRDWRQSDDLDGRDNMIPAGYDPGWFWSCEGSSAQPGGVKDKLAYGSCLAHENRCGYFNQQYVNKGLFDSYKSFPAKNEFFCTYGYKPRFTTSETGYTYWFCEDPESDADRVGCAAMHPTCGLASQIGKVYYKSSLEGNSGLLCGMSASTPRTVDAYGNNWSWLCGGSASLSAMTDLTAQEIGQTCTTGQAGCGTGNGGNFPNTAAWNACKNGDNNNCLCKTNAYASLRYPIMNRIFFLNTWLASWICKDSAGNSGGSQCVANCVNCN
jgi:hypothetical protein